MPKQKQKIFRDETEFLNYLYNLTLSELNTFIETLTNATAGQSSNSSYEVQCQLDMLYKARLRRGDCRSIFHAITPIQQLGLF